ncbi:hypothetical protein [Methylosinus sp. PW1]|uniref:hypothetical protein n=1 Tax=Methylosinus sp. PW1 TaxID=107636 RepID=UPI001FD93866|nr:hypothetical protein [Methylosinus sp. PW1]
MDERDIHADIGRYVAKLDVLIGGRAETRERRLENALARFLSAAAFFALRLHLEILPARTRAKYARIAGGQSDLRLADSTLLTFFESHVFSTSFCAAGASAKIFRSAMTFEAVIAARQMRAQPIPPGFGDAAIVWSIDHSIERRYEERRMR